MSTQRVDAPRGACNERSSRQRAPATWGSSSARTSPASTGRMSPSSSSRPDSFPILRSAGCCARPRISGGWRAGSPPAPRSLLVRLRRAHPLHSGAAFGMDGAAACFRIFGHRLDRIDRRLRGLELLPLLDYRPGVLEPSTQLLCAGIRRLRLDPARRPAPEFSPERRERQCDSSRQEREAAVHWPDATLPAASCPAARRCPTRR